MPQLLKPSRLEPMLRNKKSHHNEKPAHRDEEWSPLSATRESPHAATKTQRGQKKKKKTHQEEDFPRGHTVPHCSLPGKGWVGKNPTPHTNLHPRRSYMLSPQLGISSSRPNTGLLQGSGLDYVGWGGRRLPGCTGTSRKSKFYGLSPSIPSLSLP